MEELIGAALCSFAITIIGLSLGLVFLQFQTITTGSSET